MPDPTIDRPISPLRQRLIDDMNLRRFSRETQRNYIRDVGRFATFLRRSPDTATADDVRRASFGLADGREGYDEAQVDAYLDAAVDVLLRRG